MTEHNRPLRPRPGRAPSRFDNPEDSRREVAGQPSAPRSAAGSARPRPATEAARTRAPRSSHTPIGPSSGRLPRGFVPLALVCAGILVLGLLLQGWMPGGFPLGNGQTEQAEAARVSEIHGDGPVRINEVMSANGGVLVDASGETPDWVEVANIDTRPVNLRGYVLAKSAKAGNVFVFPDVILQSGECAVVYADSTLQAELGEELHAPFRLSSSGDVLMLFNDADVAVDTVNLPALTENEAYVRQNRNTWNASDRSTPGLLNTEENYRALTSVLQSAPVRLEQIVASNTRYNPDESGVFQDYVVLRNTSGEDVDVGGWYLSDHPQLPRLWKFPSGVVIPAGGALLVHCSGLNRRDDPAHLHTGFRLSSEGETVTLSNASGQPVDSATYDLLRTDTAYIRGADDSWSVGEPTTPQ